MIIHTQGILNIFQREGGIPWISPNRVSDPSQNEKSYPMAISLIWTGELIMAGIKKLRIIGEEEEALLDV